jgi:hypothetical protein
MKPCLPGRVFDARDRLRLALLIVCALALPVHVCATPESWPPASSLHGSSDGEHGGHGEHGLLAGSCEPIATTPAPPQAGDVIATGPVPVAAEPWGTPRAVPEPADRPPDPSRVLLRAPLRL